MHGFSLLYVNTSANVIHMAAVHVTVQLSYSHYGLILLDSLLACNSRNYAKVIIAREH